MSRRVVWLSAFAVAMGWLEAAVVVYLRALYYPAGFRFPLVPMPEQMALVEILREASTLIMLLAVAILSGSDRLDRFFVFAHLFGAWDITYYVGLFAFLRWPESMLTWDVLFLIPVPWAAPVLYPLIVSALLVAGFLVHEVLRARHVVVRPSTAEWIAASAGALVMVVCFCWQWRSLLAGATPRAFPAPFFIGGLAAAVLAFSRAFSRALRGSRSASNRGDGAGATPFPPCAPR